MIHGMLDRRLFNLLLGTGQNLWEYETRQCGKGSLVILFYTWLYIIFTDSSIMGSDNIFNAKKTWDNGRG